MNFEINGGNKNAVYSIENQKTENDIFYADLKVVFEQEEIPQTFSLTWKFPAIDCYSVWSPAIRHVRNLMPNWNPNPSPSRLAFFMPVHSIISLDGQNRMTISLSDTFNPITISTGICEEDACLDCKIEFFTVPVAPIKEYTCSIRLDLRDIPYYDSIYENTAWWENDCGYTPAFVPEHAKLPMNSLWYSYHQMLDVDDILKECKLSKELGMETVIVDDGWQTDDNSRGYAYCGDWEIAPEKIPDIKSFVDGIHNLGMKVMFWFSVPYIGVKSKNYEKFKDMLLDGDSSDVRCLDPRYKEVREFLIQTYIHAMKDWNLDGLKLDFIDACVLSGKSLEYDAKRDYQSLEDGLDALMTDVSNELRKIKSDVLIEFRQTYVGPAIKKYGNMLRVADCPNDAFSNRNDTLNLRFTSGQTAVHSDMLMWNKNDNVESAALQIASSMYSVPQISVKIAELNDEHKKMLAFYLKLWRNNKDILLDGKVIASHPETNYSIAAAIKDNKAFYTCFTENIIDSQFSEDIIAVNACGKKSIIFKNFDGKNYSVSDCMGNTLNSGTIIGNLCEIDVPLCGVVFIK